jgi:hypothetical protein
MRVSVSPAVLRLIGRFSQLNKSLPTKPEQLPCVWHGSCHSLGRKLIGSFAKGKEEFMKRIRMGFLGLALVGLLSVGAFAYPKDLKEHVTFFDDMVVSNTRVEAGDYLIRYDAETSQMMIFEGDDLVATAKATVIVHDDEFDRDAVLYTTTSMGNVLTGVRLGGQRAELQLTPQVSTISIIEVMW